MIPNQWRIQTLQTGANSSTKCPNGSEILKKWLRMYIFVFLMGRDRVNTNDFDDRAVNFPRTQPVDFILQWYACTCTSMKYTYTCMSYVLVCTWAAWKQFQETADQNRRCSIDLTYRTAFVAVDCTPHLGRYTDDFDITQAKHKVSWRNIGAPCTKKHILKLQI